MKKIFEFEWDESEYGNDRFDLEEVKLLLFTRNYVFPTMLEVQEITTEELEVRLLE